MIVSFECPLCDGEIEATVDREGRGWIAIAELRGDCLHALGYRDGWLAAEDRMRLLDAVEAAVEEKDLAAWEDAQEMRRA